MTKSLNDLPGRHLGNPPPNATGLVRQCHELHRKPLSSMTPADLRVLISQGFALDLLMPLAMQVLEKEPLIDTAYYPGDLFAAVLGVGASFWASRPNMRASVEVLLDKAQPLPREVEKGLAAFRGTR